jgi:ABC-type transporter Mla MlaB component
MGKDERPGPAGRLDLHLHGSFDRDDAYLLHALLSRVAPAHLVRVDFHEVRTLHDAALSLLARELAAPYGRHLELVGLSEHHHRLLRYIAVAR